MNKSPHFIDPSHLASVADLQLLARTVVEGFMTGLHRSPHSGASIEFAQYRPYSQGDDLRFVDWKLYARTDRLHCKQFHEETNLRCTILLDCSASMDYTSSAGPTKFQYARMLAACLAMLLSEQKDGVGFIAYHDELGQYIPPRSDPHHLRRILAEMQGLAPARRTDTAKTLQFLGDIIKPRGMVVLISDLLHPAEEMIRHLKSLRARRHDVLIFQVSDIAEQTFPFDLTQTFIDAEDAREQFAIPDLVRREYLESRRAHFAAIRAECLRSEIDIEELCTNEPLDRGLHHFIRRRNRALMTTSLKRGRAGGRA